MTAPAATPSFLSRVRQHLASFHPMERRLADFVIDFPGELSSYSATELAALAGVSNATVTRFIKRLGYQHYEDARRQVREEKENGSPLYRASRSGEATADGSAPSTSNWQQTLARLDPAEVDAMARALLAARRVWVTGFRSSQSFATYFRWQIFQVKEDIHVVPPAGDTLGQYAASMRPEDVVVVFGLRRRPAWLREVVTQIVASGAQVIYITDEQLAAHSAVAWHIHCRCASDSPLDDHTAVMGVCHLLASRVLALAGPQARERLTAIENSYDALHEL
jgi:DNA-binding MurR/RpiR family transcriptional regulator